MRVVLAEKPSVARDLAAVLGANQRKQGWIEGNGWAVTWALGHLVELREPHEYDPNWKAWRVENLPMLPETFQLRPRGDKGAQDQLKVIVSLFKQADEIICATDAGREGELIFRYILSWAKAGHKPFRRLWIQSLTRDAIEEGFRKLRNGREFDPLYQAARCRSEADWIIGLNATRYYTAKYGSRNLLWSVGRVQTPVLALIAERDIEIDAFKPEPYWRVVTDYRATRFIRPDRKYKTEAEALALVEQLRPLPLTVGKIVPKEQRIPAPQLYDLSSLQQDMNTWFGFTAEQTLATAQTLYEAKVLTYPRTDSRHIGKDIAAELPDLLRSLPTEYQSFVGPLDLYKLPLTKRIVDDTKVTDHHAILPTREPARNLQGLEAKVYAAVVRRLLAALYPPCIKNVTTVHALVGEEPFQAKGTVVADWGWQALYPHMQKQKEKKADDEDADQEMPLMEPGESGPHEPGILAKTTQPPKRYTEATLLKRMETAGRLVEDDALREAMKQRGLGTPATRAAIIETLIARKFILRQKKNLVSTEAGRHLLTLIRDPSLTSAELTGDWEARLKEIEAGSGDPAAFMNGIREHAKAIVAQQDDTAHGGLGPCPQCGAPIIEGQRGYGCSQWKDGCKFVLWKECLGTTLDAGRVRELLDIGHTLSPVPVVIDEQPVLAVLHLKKDGTLTPKPVKTQAAGANQKSLGTCPLCGGDIVIGQKAYGCSNWKQGCPFKIWKTIAKKNITQAIVKDLLTHGRTGTLEGFTSKAGKPFSTKLKLEGGEVQMDFA
jgi:DNA topoisomerase-3